VERGAQNITLSYCVRFADAVGCEFATEFPRKPSDSADGIAGFGRRLREARTRLGMTQAYVSRVELGRANITFSACEAFARALGFIFLPALRPMPRDSDGIAEEKN
jgi:hypothetical protein